LPDDRQTMINSTRLYQFIFTRVESSRQILIFSTRL